MQDQQESMQFTPWNASAPPDAPCRALGTNDMIADIMTKPLDKTTFLKLRNLLVE